VPAEQFFGCRTTVKAKRQINSQRIAFSAFVLQTNTGAMNSLYMLIIKKPISYL
jgi:hypothetical protein